MEESKKEELITKNEEQNPEVKQTNNSESSSSFQETLAEKWNNSCCPSLVSNRSFIAMCSGAAGGLLFGMKGAVVGVVGSLAVAVARDGSDQDELSQPKPNCSI